MMRITLKLLSVALLLSMASCDKKQTLNLDTVKAERGELSETVTATGTIESVTQVDVGTQVTGIIDKLYADYNTVVTKGQLIAEIEKTLLQSDLTSAEANVESARLTYEYNRTNYNRDTALHDKQLISDYEFQTSKKEYEVSKTAYDKAKADKVRAAKNLNYAEIYSPIDGIVISREVEVGQTVVSNMNVANLYTIADLDNMQVIGNVDEADIGKIKVGQAVVFSLYSYSDEQFEGQVTQVRLNPTTESNVVTYEVVVAASNPGHKLIPGLTANLIIYTMRENNVLLLPTKAFTFKPRNIDDKKIPQPSDIDSGNLTLGDRQRCVWIVNDDKLIPKVVTIGASNGLKTRILDGLTENEIVATGYSIASDGGGGIPEGERSPFAPQPPGRNKKK